MSRSTIITSESDAISLAYPESVVLSSLHQSTQTLGRTISKDSSQTTLTRARTRSSVQVTKGRSVVVITSVSVITAISSLLSGVVTVAIPTIARDLNLPTSLELWPASIFSLTCGCTLLLSGSISDVVGSRNMYLLGSMFQSAFTLACGLSQTGGQLILFRGFAGIATSFCLPSAVSIITHTFDEGPRRNTAFAAMGGGQPVGFAIGLALGGVFADSIGWRWGFYIAAILNTAIFMLALFGLPKIDDAIEVHLWKRLKSDVDWLGALIASVSLASLSYVLAALTGSTSDIHSPRIISLLTIGFLAIPAFIAWMSRQERLGRPAIIPNSLWRNRTFSFICIAVFIIWGTFNAFENILTFFFQYVQGTSAIKTSLQFLPAPVIGALTNVIMGAYVQKMRADTAILIGVSVSAIAPLLLALASSQASYWAFAFPAIALNAVGADVLFTISNLLITSVFPGKTQGLAGGVFNTIAQIGKSVGLATSAVIAASVTASSRLREKEDETEALLVGYHATFWYLFALSVVCVGLSGWGLRGIGKVGVKRE